MAAVRRPDLNPGPLSKALMRPSQKRVGARELSRRTVCVSLLETVDVRC